MPAHSPTAVLRRLAVVILVLMAVRPAGALPPGDFDPSFNGGSFVVTDLGAEDRATEVLLQSDGKIVAAGTRRFADHDDIALTRYGSDGTLDASFGAGGQARINFGSDDLQLVRVLSQADGKLLLVVKEGPFSPLISLARIHADGTLDASFGFGGLTSTPCSFCSPHTAIFQSDGKIVVAGSVSDNAPHTSDFQLIRFEPDGSLDATFGVGGFVRTDFPGDTNDFGGALVQLADGKLLAGGGTQNTTMGLARYETDGTLDASFGSGGLVFGPANASVRFLALLEGGDMIAACEVGLRRLHADGTPDVSFGSAGVVSDVYDPIGMAVSSVGDIVVLHEGPTVVISRTSSGGLRDSTFGVSSFVRPPLPGSFVESPSAGLVLDPDDRIIVAGTSTALASTDFAVGRYSGDRALRCAAAPLASCKAPVTGRSKLRVEQKFEKTRKLKWTWGNGAATTSADLGRPDEDDSYALCVYDEMTGTPSLAVESVIPSGGVCAGKPCWRAIGKAGFAYGDREETPHGARALRIKAVGDGRARLALEARGPKLGFVPLFTPVRLRLQLQSSTGACWEAVFTNPTPPGFSLTVLVAKSE